MGLYLPFYQKYQLYSQASSILQVRSNITFQGHVWKSADSSTMLVFTFCAAISLKVLYTELLCWNTIRNRSFNIFRRKMNAKCQKSKEHKDFSYGQLRDLILARNGVCVLPAKLKSLANADVKYHGNHGCATSFLQRRHYWRVHVSRKSKPEATQTNWIIFLNMLYARDWTSFFLGKQTIIRPFKETK